MYDALEQCSLELLDALDKYLGNGERSAAWPKTATPSSGRFTIRRWTTTPSSPEPFARLHEDINHDHLAHHIDGLGLRLQRRDGSWMDVNAEPGEIMSTLGHARANHQRGLARHHPPRRESARWRDAAVQPTFFVHPRPDVVCACSTSVEAPASRRQRMTSRRMDSEEAPRSHRARQD